MEVKYAFNSTPFHQYTIDETLKKLEINNYDGIEINASIAPFAEPHLSPEITEKEENNLINSIKKSNLKVSSISAHFDLIHSNEKEEEKVLNYTKQSIRIAKKLGHTIVHGYSGDKPSMMNDDEAWSKLINIVNEIVAFADSEGIKYAFEPAAGRFVNNQKSIGRLIEQVTTGPLFINLDPGNLIVADDSPEEFIEKFADKIIHVHIKDGTFIDNNIVFPPLGEGEVDFESVFNYLKEIDYKGYLSIEYEADRFGYEIPLDEVLKTSLKFMKAYT